MANYSYPGVYIEELPSGVRTITGVATSITAFVGRARRGPVNEPVTINNFGDYERIFGGLWVESAMSYAVRDFYQNGGSQAIIVRLYHPAYTEAERDDAHQAAQEFADDITTAANATDATVAGIKETVKDLADDYGQQDHSLAEKTAVQTVAAYVFQASSGTTPVLVRDAARKKADEYQSRSIEKNAANYVANAARVAAAVTNAVPDDVAAAARAEAKHIADNGISATAAVQAIADAAESAAQEATTSGADDDAAAAAAISAARAAVDDFPNEPEASYADRVAQAAEGSPSDPVTAAKAEVVAIAAEIVAQTAAASAVADAAIQEARKGVVTLVNAANSAIGIAAPLPKACISCDCLELEAANPGAWGNNIRVRIDYDVNLPESYKSYGLTDEDLFNLTVLDGQAGVTEVFRNVTARPSPRQVDKVLEMESRIVRVRGKLVETRPAKSAEPTPGQKPWADNVPSTNYTVSDKASDGGALGENDFTMQGDKKGLYALEKADLFNLLCIPPYNGNQNIDTSVVSSAATYCEKRRAMLILDSPSSWVDKETARNEFTSQTEDKIGTRSKNAALFFPRLKQPNPLHDGQIETFASCGVVAGIFARTDATRGVWKAPAGLETNLVGVSELSVPLTDMENGELNPLGINCFRTMPGIGHVIWGARTLQGNDRLASEWKYIPVRRTALYIEESLYRGTQWVVFEPNDEPLWAQIRLNIGAFMHNLFRQGAFQGKAPREAYFVKCDKETTTQNDINLGIVNIVVGFAPLKPAEFVVIKLQQIAGQIQA